MVLEYITAGIEVIQSCSPAAALDHAPRPLPTAGVATVRRGRMIIAREESIADIGWIFRRVVSEGT